MTPRPPDSIFDDLITPTFMPDHDLWQWVVDTIISEAGKLHNPDHSHLADARVGMLWTNTENARKGRRVVGMAEEPKFMCNKWQKARQERQIIDWFGWIPDFMITLDALYAEQAGDVELCMLIEHELYHCAQEQGAFGEPMFSKSTGRPKFTIIGHDVEEFVGVVRRYGTGRKGGNLDELVKAAKSKPEVSRATVSGACGTCGLQVAS